jgi:solute:Na+ symporter, SSS family
VTFYMDSISGAWKLLIVTGAGTGTVLILRWFWWRINAWSEVASMAAAFTASLALQTVFGLDSDDPAGFAYIMLITVGFTTAVWLAVTFLTPPEPMDTLVAFYRRVRPAGSFWGPVARHAPEVIRPRTARYDFLDWVAGCVLIYGSLFGVGKVILKEYPAGILLLAAAAVGGAVVYADLTRRGWKSVIE